MIKFVIKRVGQKDFDDMITKWHWLDEKFGQCCYDQTTWSWEWYDCSGSEDYVNFVFYDEAMATWFKLQFPDVQTVKEFEYASYSV
jgi:hypothetical protein